MSAITGKEADDIDNLMAARYYHLVTPIYSVPGHIQLLLVTHRVKISGVLHSLSSAGEGKTAAPVVSAGFSKSLNDTGSESFNVASSSINWNGGDTVLQVPSLDNINAEILHKWDQSLALKPAVLTTDLVCCSAMLRHA